MQKPTYEEWHAACLLSCRFDETEKTESQLNEIIRDWEAFTLGHAHIAKHVPTGEEWVFLGVDVIRGKVCAAGWPPTAADLADMRDFRRAHRLTDTELKYRRNNFLNFDWI